MNIIIDKVEFYIGLIVGIALMVAFIKFKEWQYAKDKNKEQDNK